MQYKGKWPGCKWWNACVKTQHKSAICNFWHQLQISDESADPSDPAFPSPYQCRGFFWREEAWLLRHNHSRTLDFLWTSLLANHTLSLHHFGVIPLHSAGSNQDNLGGFARLSPVRGEGTGPPWLPGTCHLDSGWSGVQVGRRIKC